MKGRTTRLLEKVCEMLYDGQYSSIAFVVHHINFARYACMLVCDHCQSRALYSQHQQRLSFRNRFGQLVHIQFIPMNREYEMTRGYRNPVVRDHEVLSRRIKFLTHSERTEVDKLIAADQRPFSEMFIRK